MLIRGAGAGLEVLMLKRKLKTAFGGAWVFPGGMLDPQDRDPGLYRRCLGLSDHRASRLLALPRDGLAYWVAAIRETFEESGLLMAVNGCGQVRRATSGERKALINESLPFAELCRRRNLKLAAGRMRYVAHWITPRAAPKRFSTRFLVAEAAPGRRAGADGQEVLEARWFAPGQALRPEIPLAHPTRHFLRILHRMGSVRNAMNWAASASRGAVPATRPEVRRIDGQLMSCLPTGEVLGPFSSKHHPVPSARPAPAAISVAAHAGAGSA